MNNITPVPLEAIANNVTTFSEFLRSELNQDCVIRFAGNVFEANLALPETVPGIIEWLAQRGTSNDLLTAMDRLAECLANAAAALLEVCDDYRDLVERQKTEVEDFVITLNMGDSEAEAA